MKKKREALILDPSCQFPLWQLCALLRSTLGKKIPMEISKPQSFFQDIRSRELHGFRGSLYKFTVHNLFFAVWYNQSVWVSYDYHMLCFSSSKATVHQWPGIRFLWNWGHCCWTQRPSNGDFVWQGTKSADEAFPIRESHFSFFLFLFLFLCRRVKTLTLSQCQTKMGTWACSIHVASSLHQHLSKKMQVGYLEIKSVTTIDRWLLLFLLYFK